MHSATDHSPADGRVPHSSSVSGPAIARARRRAAASSAWIRSSWGARGIARQTAVLRLTRLLEHVQRLRPRDVASPRLSRADEYWLKEAGVDATHVREAHLPHELRNNGR